MVVGAGTELNRVISLGSDYYESQESVEQHEREGKPRIGIGANCKIENAIIDKNARIGNNVKISPAGKPEKLDHELYYIRDGIVIIPKNAIIPHGTVLKIVAMVEWAGLRQTSFRAVRTSPEQ